MIVRKIHTSLFKKSSNFFYFVLCCRNMRGHIKKHKSMLIHASRFVDVQNRVYQQIEKLISEFRNDIDSKDTIFLKEIEDVWSSQFLKYENKKENPLPSFERIVSEKRSLMDNN